MMNDAGKMRDQDIERTLSRLREQALDEPIPARIRDLAMQLDHVLAQASRDHCDTAD
ncbi:hypothetical protein SAMN06265221_11469 [Paracoccus laeviglucosivorans]|uniref:Anti-sigma factor NepR domain-containing protein n=1 Tax=Paracoccus laeviglucosivorans TaxID=1197861 RepID=A0A521ENV7_9RHOB|nr:hypothetical protein SAMN06265221_11469 [Paracoccus laeviglucosivorans]